MQDKGTEIIPLLTYRIKHIAFIVAMLFMALAVILNLYMRRGLFLLGLNQVQTMQGNSSPFLDFLNNAVSLLGTPWIITPLLLAIFILIKQRIRVFVYLVYVMAGISLMAVWKQMFQQSRPFWFNSQISKIEWFCPTDFGHPSGHSFAIVALYEPIINDFIGISRHKLIALIIWTVLVALVMGSRMYLGVHSLDQIILGGLLGLCWLVLYRYWLQEQIYAMLSNLVNQVHKKIYFVFNTCFLVLVTVFMLTSHILNRDHRLVSSDSLDNLNQSCGKDYSSPHLQKGALVGTTHIYFAFGIIYGFILLTNPEQADTMYMTGDWRFAGRQEIMIYLFYFSVVVLVPAVTLVLVFPIVISSAVLCFVFSALGITWAGMAIPWLMGTIQRKQNLVKYDEEGGADDN